MSNLTGPALTKRGQYLYHCGLRSSGRPYPANFMRSKQSIIHYLTARYGPRYSCSYEVQTSCVDQPTFED